MWAVPTLGGAPHLYLMSVAEFDWSADGSLMVYHTPGPGDPTFVREPGAPVRDRSIFAAAAGLHAHFPTWAPDQAFIYFVQGSLPDARVPADMDIWRIRPSGGAAERITRQNAGLSHVTLLKPRTLIYLATDRDGSGPWLYGLDVDHRVPHRLSRDPNRYTSLAASADGRRLVATLTNPNPKG